MAVFCLLRPKAARLFVGGFFGVMGLVVHGFLVITNPEGYVRFTEQALFPFYRQIGLFLTEPNSRAFWDRHVDSREPEVIHPRHKAELALRARSPPVRVPTHH